jgi:hypothetical protein
MPPVEQIVRRRARALAGSVNSHRLLLYGFLSTIAMSAAIVNALKNHSNFYSVAIYLSKSSRSVLVSCLRDCVHCDFFYLDIFITGSGKLRVPTSVGLWPHCPANILWFTPRQRNRSQLLVICF